MAVLGDQRRPPRRQRTALGVAALAAATLMSTVGVLAPTTAPAEARGTSLTATTYETTAFAGTNLQRVTRGRVAVVPRTCLHKWAVRQARRMAAQQQMFHQDLERVAADCGLSYAGENVAYGYPSGAAVVRAWMNSPGHRANILNRHYRGMGIGARQGSDGVWYVSQVFGRAAG